MPSAYILLKISSGSEDQVLKKIRNIAEVQKAFFSYGEFDLVLKIKADSMEQLKKTVSYRLRAITNVKSTLTLIEAEERKIIVNT